MIEQPIARAVRTYKVNSLDRGLDILRVIRNADGPVRNHDLVTRTGLPKATVSRLVHTLTVMGYLRRIDQGSYVLGQASGRTGRAMLEGLKLEQYAALFQEVVARSDAYASFGMMVDHKVVSVFRWSSTENILITSGLDIDAVDNLLLMTECCLHVKASGDSESESQDLEIRRQLFESGWCQRWSQQSARLTIATGVRLHSVGLGVLAFHMPQETDPSAEELAMLGKQLLAAATAIASETPKQ